MKVLLDTCVIIDAIQQRDEAGLASRIIIDSDIGGYFCYVTANAISDIHYINRKYFVDNEGIPNEDLNRSALKDLFQFVGVLPFDESICKSALYSSIRDYEDALVVEVAKDNAVDCIVTRNLKDFEKSPIPVYSPEEFIKMVESENQQVA